ncbi:MAG TPA: DUF3313 domain-containing protein, partial [Desulfovibrio sp.]|nr:DUF3313 domain-containing protein [Desulfovibrio sp.]
MPALPPRSVRTVARPRPALLLLVLLLPLVLAGCACRQPPAQGDAKEAAPAAESAP